MLLKLCSAQFNGFCWKTRLRMSLSVIVTSSRKPARVPLVAQAAGGMQGCGWCWPFHLQLRHVFLHRVVQRQLSSLCQQVAGVSRELLGGRFRGEPMFGLIGMPYSKLAWP